MIGLTGTSFANDELRRQLLGDVYFLASIGARPVIVHGGCVSAAAYAQQDGLHAEQEIANEINQMLADEYESIGGRAMTLNFESGAVLFGETDPHQSIGRITSVDRIVVDNLCYAGQTPIIPAMFAEAGNQCALADDVLSIPFIAGELAAKVAVIVGHDSIFESMVRDQSLNTAIDQAMARGVESFHLINSSFSHGLLLQLFSQQRLGIVIGKLV